jgi:hypothetical protein
MYPRIPWELVADPLESAEHNLGTTGEGLVLYKIFYVLFNKTIPSRRAYARLILFVLHDNVQFS